MKRFGGFPAVLVALAVAMAACTGGGSSAPARSGESGPVTAAQRAELESFARSKLPDGAVVADLDDRAALDRSVLTRFTIDRADLDRFVADAGMTRDPAPGVQPLQAGVGDGLGWKVDELADAVGYDDERDHVVRQFLVDLATPGRAVVYLHAFTT